MKKIGATEIAERAGDDPWFSIPNPDLLLAVAAMINETTTGTPTDHREAAWCKRERQNPLLTASFIFTVLSRVK
jgi:hypothetical protein